MTKPEEYRNGGVGFAKWCEENVYVPIYPEGSDIATWTSMQSMPESYRVIWEEQKKIALQALEMKNGRFVHNLIVLCWMRGEGKSLLACLIQLWKFFNWPRQQIMLGANSKEQTKFVHYDIMRDIILNSPRLLAVIGGNNVREKEIRLRDRKGNVVSIIRAISSFSGIVSNITGFTFSEIFDMKNPKFYVQLYGSIRNIPNALGVIDSTVSAKTHVLYNLFESYQKGTNPLLYYSYRCSPGGVPEDFWNPNMTSDQLDAYRDAFPFGEFERYFMNVWSAGARRVFTDEMIEEMKYIGADGLIGNHPLVRKLIEKKLKVLEQRDRIQAALSLSKAKAASGENVLADIETRLKSVKEVYTLGNELVGPEMATIEDLQKLGGVYDTGWAVLCGFDRADPMGSRPNARTVYSVIAKGLPGSKSNPHKFYNAGVIPRYIYLVLQLTVLAKNNLEEMKELIQTTHSEYDGIDRICAERWGMFDIQYWAEHEEEILFELISPTYDRQKTAFTELFTSVRDGLFKAPRVWHPGYKKDDILVEEMTVFNHDIEKKVFASPEKDEKGGVQDDCMYSIGWAMFGGRDLGFEDFRDRSAKGFWGQMIPGERTLGAY